MEVYKITLSIDVYQAADSADAARSAISGMSVEEVLEEAYDGGFIAATPNRSDPEHIPRDAVEAEMLSIGNDGSFFDLDLDLMDEEDAEEEDGESDGDT